MSGENNPHFSPFSMTRPGAARQTHDTIPDAAYLREHPEIEAMFDEPTAVTLAEITAPNHRSPAKSEAPSLAAIVPR